GEGVDIPVGTPVAFIYGESETVSAPSAPSVKPVVKTERKESAIPSVIQPAEAKTVHQTGLPRATPLARRLARERGIELPVIAGSGPVGRIQAEDVKNFRAAQKVIEPPPPADNAITSLYQRGSYDIEPV